MKAMLDTRASRYPDRRIALFEDGRSWTYAECREEVRRAAAALQALGVKKGDRVIAWLPTGLPMILTWFAANYLGAIFVPLNTAYRGKVLEHVINKAAATVMVAHPELRSRLSDLETPLLRHVIGAEALQGDASGLDDSATVEHWYAAWSRRFPGRRPTRPASWSFGSRASPRTPGTVSARE